MTSKRSKLKLFVSGVPRHGRFSVQASLLLVAPLAILLIVIFLLPIGSLLLQSVTKPTWSLQHYQKLWDQPLYVTVILRTIRIAAGTVIGALLLGYPIALLMSRVRGKAATIIAALVLVPLWTSALVRTYSWIVMLRSNGVINNTLIDLRLIDSPLTLLYTEGAVLAAMIHVLLPYMILPIYSVVKSIPPDYEKAALNLGASKWEAFFRVTVPLSVSGISAGCVIVFVLALGFYLTPALIGGPKTLLIATLISQQATEFLNWPFAAAISTVLLVLSVGLTALLSRLLRIDRSLTL